MPPLKALQCPPHISPRLLSSLDVTCYVLYRYTQDPAFKNAMGRAGEKVEELARDPVKLKKAEADFTEALKA